ncbi:hypothetical protein SAMN05216198_1556 [Halopseudomonas litoralis]|uniref:Uncharacterized protein n=1 Tax=Halopseudomonas litoralis TaxID=797277 RepID=A0A1H1QQV9_9GAMM|nr:hypothetical protein [Halopseudomonas litoralis]SDS25850.1 hypothetical protein SAMN05216198_1556 [Halopseudomonas litoralis]
MKASLKITDLDDALAQIQSLGSMAGKAQAQAMNDVVKVANEHLVVEANTVFDRPTPFTLNAFRIQYAKPSNPEAAIWVKDEKSGASKGQAPEDWFGPQVYGGERALKASEKMLRSKGVLPAGLYAVPGKGARLDAYGNMSRGHLMQMLSGLKVFDRSGSDHNATGSRRSKAKGHEDAFFILRREGQPIGIAERRGKAVEVVLAFVKQPQYAPRFDFHGTVRKVSENDALVEAAVDKAVASTLAGSGR